MKIDIAYLKELEDERYTQEMRVWLAAKHYIACGIPVVPLRPNQKILPPAKLNVTYHQAAATAKVIDQWFEPESGKFAGWNIGLGCGRENGIFVVDVDKKPQDDGFASLAGLVKEHGELPPTPCQVTPNGGHHYIFNWQTNCMSSTGKIGKSIDTRGGDERQVKSHIVAFPSIIDGKMYTWQSGTGQVADVPSWVMERMGVPWRARQAVAGGRGSEDVGEEDLEKIVPVAQIVQMLEPIPIDNLSYDEWLQIGQAIHSQHPGDEGLAVWDEWSQRGERYERRECHKRWHGFDGTGNIRIGTLYYFAKREGGWSPRPDDVTSSKMDELVAEMNQQYGMCQIEGKIWIIRKKGAKAHLNAANFDFMTRDSFKALLENTKMITINPSSGKATVKTHAEIWLAHHARATFEEGMGLFPDGARPGFFNLWQGFAYAPRPGNVQPFLDHVLHTVCNGNTNLYNWVIDWCAHAVQYPQELVGTAIVMRGLEGTGKGLFADTFGRLWGPHYIHLIDEKHLTSNFNIHMMAAVVVFADEVVWGGNKKSANALKGIVSENYIMYEKKGVDAFPGQNYSHLIMATNEEWAVPAGAHSRRWLVLDVDNSRRGDDEHWNSFVQWRENGGYEALLHYLMYEREIDKIATHLRRAPETEAVSEQREMQQSSDPLTNWWMYTLEMGSGGWEQVDSQGNVDNDYIGWPSQVMRHDVYSSYIRWFQSNGFRYSPDTTNKVYRRLRTWGIIGDSSHRVQIGNVRKYYFIVPPLEECRKAFTKATGITLE